MSTKPKSPGGPPEPKDPYLVALGRNLADAIERSGLSKGEVAKRAKKFDPTIHQPSISFWLGGTRRPKAKQLDAVARVLGLKSDDLLPKDRDLQAATGVIPGTQAVGEVPSGVGSGELSRVGAAIADYIRRQGRAPDAEETEIITAWLKADPPPFIDDELIEGLLAELRGSFRRAAARLADRRGRGAPGEDGNGS
jgi:transcriptional regulator with XRE-family HTH domain